MTVVSPLRVRVRNDREVAPHGRYVLYWMTAARRLVSNFALDRALELAREHGKPLLVLEALRIDYPHASPRFHRFVLEGMSHNQAEAKQANVRYLAYVEAAPGEGRGLLRALSEHAVAVVADDWPCSFHPAMIAAGAAQSVVRLETVDGNGILPLDAADRSFPTAYAFRRFLQATLPGHLASRPVARAWQ